MTSLFFVGGLPPLKTPGQPRGSSKKKTTVLCALNALFVINTANTPLVSDWLALLTVGFAVLGAILTCRCVALGTVLGNANGRGEAIVELAVIEVLIAGV